MSPTTRDPDAARRALLPAGLRDVLPPDAAREAATVERLVACFESHGYERVKPPLIEFEDSLFSGPGAAMTEHAFRLMDPVSRRMMGVRADMTAQVARIAAARLGHLPRPLRLCYAGEVLRVAPGALDPERELVQVGAELVGEEGPAADVEAILLAADGLRRIGAARISVDIAAPRLVSDLLAALGIDPAARPGPRAGLDRKDPVAVARHGGPAAPALAGLMAATGAREEATARLLALDLPEAVRPAARRLAEVAAAVAAAEPDLAVTIDPVENRGFEYYTGLGFSLFARGTRGELGRGGRYLAGGGEGSCGFTLYMETVLRAIAEPEPPARLYVPFGVSRADAARARADGWIAVAGLAPEADGPAAAAAALGCGRVLLDGAPVPLEAAARGDQKNRGGKDRGRG